MEATISADLEVTAALSRRCVAPGAEESEPLGALISIRSGQAAPASPVPIEMCLVIDASGSMHRFHLDAEQRALWSRVAAARGDLVCDTADGKEGWLWSGETLREMRGLVRTPMMAVVRALEGMARQLAPADRLTVIAFADTAEILLRRANAAECEQAVPTVVERLARGVDESGLGRGSRLAEALVLARDALRAASERPRRILVVSDGVVEERATCLREAEAAADDGTLVSTIGVGEEFDEELLMQMADDACGRYTYAPTTAEVEAVLEAETQALSRTVARGLTITVVPHRDAVFRELFRLTPAVAWFNTLWMDHGGYRYRLGDLPAGEEVRLLAQFALPPAVVGDNPVGTIQVSTQTETIEVTLSVIGSGDAEQVWERDPQVLAAMEAVEAYRSERRAHLAAMRRDLRETTRHLRHTTRILQRMGQRALAGEFEALANDLEAGRTLPLNRTKRLKAATRRLGEPASGTPVPRDLVWDRET